MSSNFQVERICEYCKTEFIAKTSVTRYCSHKCNRRAYKENIRLKKINTSNQSIFRIKSNPFEILNAKEFLTVKDVAKLLNCSVRTIYRLIDQDTIKATRLTERKTLIKKSDINKLFD